MTVRKAVIPAAGLGTRFLPATKSQPKEMLPILDKPTIQYVVEEAVESGINQILIITNQSKRAIEDHFDRTSRELEENLIRKGKERLLKALNGLKGRATITYQRQERQNGLGDAVLVAKDWVGSEPFALLLGDDVVYSDKSAGQPPCTKQLMDVFGKTGYSAIAVEPVTPERIPSYGIVGIDGALNGDGRTHKVTTLVEKPKAEDAPSNLGILGRYVLQPGIFDCLGRTKPGYGGELQLTDGLRLMLEEGSGIAAYEFMGHREDLGNPRDWLFANIHEALRREEFREDVLDFMRGELDRTEGGEARQAYASPAAARRV